MNLPSGQTKPSNLLGAPRHQSQVSSNPLRSTALPDHRNVPQTQSAFPSQPASAAVDESEYVITEEEEEDGEEMAVHKRRRDARVTGVSLVNRRRQAKDRILQGGWRADIAEMAIECAESRAWSDTTASNWSVRAFARDAEKLGELCTDMRAIRAFLDTNIHKFIAFHAMEKDFQVPRYLVYKANQRRGDRVLKYPWFRSFIREYQGSPSSANNSWVQRYKDQAGEPRASDRTSQPAPIDHEGSIRATITTAPATVAMDAPPANETNDPAAEWDQVTLNNEEHSRKRDRVFDDSEDLENFDLAKRIKTEPTEDDFFGSQYQGHKTETTGATIQGVAGTGEEDGGQEMIHNIRRTLTVMFHGMRDDDSEESEHVQVYVPRTAKGVTINLL